MAAVNPEKAAIPATRELDLAKDEQSLHEINFHLAGEWAECQR